MKQFGALALDTATAQGATYADVRVMDIRQRYLSTKNGETAQVRESESYGLGVRVIVEGAWGFASTDDLTRQGVLAAAAKAVEIARASALAKKQDVQLAPEPKIIDHWEGPCRIDPFGEGPQQGVCGASADLIVARSLGRSIAAGASAHSDHGRDILEVFSQTAAGETSGYRITDEGKLRRLAEEWHVAVDGRASDEVARDLAEAMFADFGSRKDRLGFTERVPDQRRALWDRLGLPPRGLPPRIAPMASSPRPGDPRSPTSRRSPTPSPARAGRPSGQVGQAVQQLVGCRSLPARP